MSCRLLTVCAVQQESGKIDDDRGGARSKFNEPEANEYHARGKGGGEVLRTIRSDAAMNA